MTDDDELLAWLTLLRAPGLGGAGLRALLQRAGTARTIGRDARRLPGLEPAALEWIAHPDTARLDADLGWLAQPSHRLLRCDEADFPPPLETIPHPPCALSVAGAPPALLAPQIAIVGARSATAQGLANARDFARTLSRAGLVVTSGMADGIDGAAHVAALESGGQTVAVIGTGPDLVYPRKHRDLAARIEQSGAIVSEFPPGTEARPDHFPRRNRLIAGLSLGTLVVEAGLQSGSLITGASGHGSRPRGVRAARFHPQSAGQGLPPPDPGRCAAGRNRGRSNRSAGAGRAGARGRIARPSRS